MIEAMKQWLEALELCTNEGMIPMYLQANQKAITSLRQAIAEAEKQEPVAWGIANTRPTERNPLMMVMLDEPAPSHLVVPLYTHPQPKREWIGLTHEEINKLRYKKDWTAPWTDTTFARAIEAKLKEKNT